MQRHEMQFMAHNHGVPETGEVWVKILSLRAINSRLLALVMRTHFDEPYLVRGAGILNGFEVRVWGFGLDDEMKE